MQSSRCRAVAVVALLLPVFLGACRSASTAEPPSSPIATAPTQTEYRIQAGDALGVKFFFNPELNEEVLVRPDGRISLQLVDEVDAAGRTPAELTARLRELYSSELAEPEIAVILRLTGQRVFVDGEVLKPGELVLTGPITVLEAIARAGGVTDRARMTNVILIRKGPDATPTWTTYDVKSARGGRDATQNPELVPYDVVYVPRSNISNVNVWVDQYIRKNIPFTFGFRLEF